MTSAGRYGPIDAIDPHDGSIQCQVENQIASALLSAARAPVKGLNHHGPTMPHPGPNSQPLACALTADGVPIRAGMRCFDYNLNEVEIVESYSEGVQPEPSVKVRVRVGVVMRDVHGPSTHTYSGCWACLFSTREAAEVAKEKSA